MTRDTRCEPHIVTPSMRVAAVVSHVPQVYRAKLKSTGEYVAVKVQRPKILDTVSKDLYVRGRTRGTFLVLSCTMSPRHRVKAARAARFDSSRQW